MKTLRGKHYLLSYTYTSSQMPLCLWVSQPQMAVTSLLLPLTVDSQLKLFKKTQQKTNIECHVLRQAMQKKNPTCQVKCGQRALFKHLKQDNEYNNEVQDIPEIYINPIHVHVINIWSVVCFLCRRPQRSLWSSVRVYVKEDSSRDGCLLNNKYNANQSAVGSLMHITCRPSLAVHQVPAIHLTLPRVPDAGMMGWGTHCVSVWN